MKKSYAHIDLWKLIFAVAVLSIHTSALSGFNAEIRWYASALFTRMGVPFFMITSSFLLGKKIRAQGPEGIKAYRKALLPKLLFWGALALVMNAPIWYLESRSIAETLLTIVQYALFYPKGAMWFLWALIVSSFLLEFFLKHKVPVSVMGVIALALFAFALLCNTYYFVVENTAFSTVVEGYLSACVSARNGVFLFVYMLLGYMLSSERGKERGKGSLRVACIIGFGLLVWEAISLQNVNKLDDSSLFLSYLFLIPAFILLLTRSESPVPHNRELRSLSGVMYYTHPVFSSPLKLFLSGGWMRFSIVLAATLIVWLLTRRSGNKIIKKLLY